jgi:opacity protein-like surface antigen
MTKKTNRWEPLRHRTGRHIAGISLALLMCTTPSLASDGYIGVRGGAGDGPRDAGGAASQTEIVGGYRVLPWLAIELGLTQRDSSDRLYAFGESIDTDIEVQGVTLSARAELPIASRWRGYARLGIGNFDIERRHRALIRSVNFDGSTVVVNLLTGSGHADMGYVAGLGVDYVLSDHWSLGVEAQRLGGQFRLSCRETTGICDQPRSGQLDALTATIRYDF